MRRAIIYAPKEHTVSDNDPIKITPEQHWKIRQEADARYKHMHPNGPYAVFGFFGGGIAAMLILMLAGIDPQHEKGYVVGITALVSAAIGHFYEKHKLEEYFAAHRAYSNHLEAKLLSELHKTDNASV